MELSKSELFNRFSSFPDANHAKNVCRIGQGKKMCRYVTKRVSPNSDGYLCEKAGEYRKILDKDVRKGAIDARGDNCDGVLGFVNENQQSLVGLTVLTQIQAKGEEIKNEEGFFDVLIVEDGHVTIGNIQYEPKEEVEVTINSQGITFLKIDDKKGSERNFRKETILFEKPVPKEA